MLNNLLVKDVNAAMNILVQPWDPVDSKSEHATAFNVFNININVFVRRS